MIDYGIQNESSHIRAHVCPKVRRVYTYPTACGIAAIRSGKFRKVNGFQPGVASATAEGYLVPPFEIAKCAAIQLNASVWDCLRFSKDDSLGEKGKKAELLIKQMVAVEQPGKVFLGLILERRLQEMYLLLMAVVVQPGKHPPVVGER